MKSKPMLSITFVLAVSAALALALPVAVQAQDSVPAKLLAKAKVTRVEAEKIALAAVPKSTVKAAELEEEDGGLRWSFDLNTPGTKKITEVGVDAITGKIVENKVENEKDEAKEGESEKQAKSPSH